MTYGLSLSLCQIRWQTVLFNKFFSKVGRSRPRLSLLWFNAGAVFAVIAMATSLVLLSTMLYQSIKETKPERVLQPVVGCRSKLWKGLLWSCVSPRPSLRHFVLFDIFQIENLKVFSYLYYIMCIVFFVQCIRFRYCRFRSFIVVVCCCCWC